MRHPNILGRDQSVLFIVDVQERFREHIVGFDHLAANIATLVKAAAILDLPVIVTEQYPRGLGPTVNEIKSVLDELSGFEYYEKSCFSGFSDPAICAYLNASGRKQVILTGIETHVCVNQTAHDLILKGYSVHLVMDAVSSRSEGNKRIGARKIETAGGVLTSVETALFEMLVESGTETFKAVQKLVK